MRIAIITESWRPSVDGVVTRLDNTVRVLRDGGHDVLVVAPTLDGGLERVDERRTATLSLRFLYGGRPWALPGRAAARALRDFAPDVVHVVNPVLMGSFALRHAARRYPVVVSYHTDVSAYASHYHLGFLRPLLHLVMRGVYRRADVRLATSDVGCAHLHQVGVGDVEVWGRGVDNELFRPDRDGTAMRRRFDPAPGKPVVLYVGRLAHEKHCERLLPLAAPGGPFHVVLVGDGPDRARLQALAEGHDVTFTGFLRGDDLADAYAAADVFVFPSQTDTLGLVLLEAMASGLPVVATDSPAARHTLAEYDHSALVPGDASAAELGTSIAGLLERSARDPVDPPSVDPPSVDPPSVDPPGEGDDPDRADLPRPGGWEPATDSLLEAYKSAQNRHRRAPRGGRHHRGSRRRRVGRFALVGGANAAIDLGTFNVFVLAHPTRSASLLVFYNTVAVVLALLNSYVWNSRWTFKDRAARHRAHLWRRRLLFLLQGGFNLAVNDAVVLGLSLLLRPDLGIPTTVASDLAKVVAMFVASAVSYVVMNIYVFRHHPPFPPV